MFWLCKTKCGASDGMVPKLLSIEDTSKIQCKSKSDFESCLVSTQVCDLPLDRIVALNKGTEDNIKAGANSRESEGNP